MTANLSTAERPKKSNLTAIRLGRWAEEAAYRAAQGTRFGYEEDSCDGGGSAYGTIVRLILLSGYRLNELVAWADGRRVTTRSPHSDDILAGGPEPSEEDLELAAARAEKADFIECVNARSRSALAAEPAAGAPA